MKKITWKTTGPALLLTAALGVSLLGLSVLGLSGCGSGSKSAPAYVSGETMAAAYDVYEEEMAMDSFTDISEESGISFGESPDTGVNPQEGDGGPQLPSGRKLIRNVDMDVETDSFDSLLSQLSERIKSLGGYVEESSSSGRRTNRQNEPIPRSAYLTARIPSDKLDLFVNAVEENGNVITKSETTQDVTLQYSDLESRKKSLTIEQDRIWAILEKADTLESVIALEERLSEIRYELESMESKLRLMDNQVDYSTVTIRINEVTDYTPTSPETVGQRIGNGFSGNLKKAADFFVGLFIVIVSGSPIWLPLLILVLLTLYLMRRHNKKSAASAAGRHTPSDSAGQTSGSGQKAQETYDKETSDTEKKSLFNKLKK